MTPEEIKKENNLGTLKFFIFSLITFGIYPLFRIKTHADLIQRFSGQEVVTQNFILGYRLSLVVCFISGIVLDFFEESTVLSLVDFAAVVVNFVMPIIFSFRARKILENYVSENYRITYRLNGFYTFVFNLFYINYCLNDLENDVPKSQFA